MGPSWRRSDIPVTSLWAQGSLLAVPSSDLPPAGDGFGLEAACVRLLCPAPLWHSLWSSTWIPVQNPGCGFGFGGSSQHWDRADFRDFHMWTVNSFVATGVWFGAFSCATNWTKVFPFFPFSEVIVGFTSLHGRERIYPAVKSWHHGLNSSVSMKCWSCGCALCVPLGFYLSWELLCV